jgi:hypothetical protein
MRAPLLVLACLALAAPGCSRPDAVLKGTVTFNGIPLEEGYITFFPVESVAATCGTDIRAGAYELKQPPPGSWRVLIAPPPKARVVRTAQGQERVVVSATNTLSATTTGNNQVVSISADDQTLDFHLRSRPTGR